MFFHICLMNNDFGEKIHNAVKTGTSLVCNMLEKKTEYTT